MVDIPQSQPNNGANQPLPSAAVAELQQWLRDASRNAIEVEQAQNDEPRQKEDIPLETAGFEPIEFQLATGNNVKVVFAKFWERIRYQDWREGALPAQYHAIKIYSTEDILPRSMAVHCEFRGGNDFTFLAVPKIWDWLDDLVKSRRFAEYDFLSEFIDELAEVMNRATDGGEDAVEHVQRLPELVVPEIFDKVDDSIFNDQNGSGLGTE